MGALGAEAMAAAAGEGEVSMRMALMWHLQSNTFPPVHSVYVTPAMEAIRHVANEDYDVEISRPGSSGEFLTAIEIVEGLHLWSFVDNADAVPEGEL